MASRCRDAIHDLLPFYANGSLEGEEAQAVARHLEASPECARECDTLLVLAASIDRAGDLSIARGAARVASGRALLGIAAMGLVIVGAAVAYLALQGRGGGADPLPAGIVALDLGSGALRGESAVPATALTHATAVVRLVVSVPPEPGAGYTAEIRDDAGTVLLAARPIGPLDRLGRTSIDVAATLLEGGGDYLLVVRAQRAGAPSEEFQYPFRVTVPDQESRRP